MPDGIFPDEAMTPDDAEADSFVITRRKRLQRPGSPQQLEAEKVVFSLLVFFMNNGTETPITCAVTAESTLTEIESMVRSGFRLGKTPIQFFVRTRSDREVSPISVFPREQFGEFDLVFLCLPKLTAHLNPSSHTESNELQNKPFAFDSYRKVGLIGKGAQGKVNRYQHKASDELIAVKRSRLEAPDITNAIVKDKILREIHSLMRFRHPCIVQLLGYDLQIESRVMRIAMPYIGPDSLESVLKSPENHPWLSSTSKTMIIVGIVVGMYLVHYGGIIHRDLKPANILIDPISHCPKIADFGLSREENINISMTYETGTPLYMAPEMFVGERYSNKVDIFSFGILLYEIVTGQKPLQGCGDGQFQLLSKILHGDREKIPDTVEPFTAGLIRRCWDGNPHRRPAFVEIFYELQANRFKVFDAVDSEAVEQFLQSLM
jgi:serine/threonine protein kinase